MAICIRCFEDKSVTEFQRFMRGATRPWCKACSSLPVLTDYEACKAEARALGARAREAALASGLTKARANVRYRHAYSTMVMKHPSQIAAADARAAARRKLDPNGEKRRAHATRAKQPAVYTALYAISSARKSAAKKGVPFSLVLEDVWPIPECCPALGTPFVFGINTGRSNASPSLDRIVPTLGYVPGNVHWISDLANRIKSDATWQQIRRVADYLESIS